MYIGRLGNGSNPGDGIYVLLKEIVDNCIDEFSAGFGNKVLIDIDGKQVRVRDFGRGIPLGSVAQAADVHSRPPTDVFDSFQSLYVGISVFLKSPFLSHFP